METKVPPPSHYRSGIPAALEAVVLRGLELEPADRFPTAEAMAIALRRAHAAASPVEIARWLERFAPDELEMAEERVRLLEQRPYAASTDGGATPVVHVDWSAETTSLEHPRGGRRARWIGAGAIALVTAAVALFLRAKTGHRTVDAAPSPPPVSEPVPSTVPASPSTAAEEPAAVERSPAAAPSRTRRKSKSSCDP